MGDEPESVESQLLDLHLGRLDPEDARQAEEAIATSPELAAHSAGLRSLLGMLDAAAAPEPPETLADSVLARIDDQAGILPFKEAASALPAGTAQDLSASSVLSLRELIAIAACITLFVGVFVPGYFKAQRMANRNLCRQNIRQICQATIAYAQDNNDVLPWVGYVPKGSWLATRTPNVRRYSNTKPMFLLMKTGKKWRIRDPRVFLCPSDPNTRPMIAEDYRQFSDFAEPANVSYSFMFMNRPEPRFLDKTGKRMQRMVLGADRNPLFDSRAVSQRIDPYDDVGNSFAHDRAGQNAVYIDGHGDWFTDPNIGVDRDNIYRAGELVHYEGTEEPVSEEDTFLP